MSDPSRPTILIVDDMPENLDVLCGILRSDYHLKVAISGERALRLAATRPHPDLILLDVMMPDLNGYEVCRQLKENVETRAIPVIFVTAMSDAHDETRGFALGAVDYITKPISPPTVRARVKTHLALYDQNRALEDQVMQRTGELNNTRLQIIQCLGRAAEFKDNETGMHVYRISHYTRVMAENLGLSAARVDLLFNAAPMHDIGKIGIADRILLKPGPLDANEWAMMQQHTRIGAKIIGQHHSDLLQLAQKIALSHHERWDGTGYPLGLAREDILLEARIVAIVDVFDALTHDRPYKKAWALEDAITTIQAGAGSHFDPDLVHLFINVLPEILKIIEQYQDR